jgi:hypothetical protein
VALIDQVWLQRHRERLKLERERARFEWREAATLMVGFLSDQSRLIGPKDIEISAWLIPSGGGNTPLEEVGSFSLDSRPARPMQWTLGKGPLGHAWETGFRFHVDWDTLGSQPEDGNDDPRLGMTSSEVELMQRFSASAALPLFDQRGQVLGCLSIDCNAGIPSDELLHLVGKSPVVRTFVDVAEQLAEWTRALRLR